MNKQKLHQTCYKSLARLKKASPTILTCIGAVGVIVTAVLAARAAPKASERVRTVPQKPTKLEVIRLSWKYYIPTAIAGTATIACIFGANAINRRQNALLIGAYTMLSKSYKDYREVTKKLYGEDSDAKIIAEVAKNVYVEADGMGLYSFEEDFNNEKVLFYDSCTKRYFSSTLPAVINAEYHVNRMIQLQGYITLNEFSDFLGIEHIENGDVLGWDFDEMLEYGLLWLDFDNSLAKMDDGLECYIITPMVAPMMEVDYHNCE